MRYADLERGVMFRGVATLNLDNKARLAVPARYREILLQHCGGRLVITADPSKCLLIYPQSDWEPIQEQLMAMPSFNRKARSLQRLLVGYAEDVDMDGAGRILVSTPLRDFAGLDKRVVLVGQGRKFELWDEGNWITQGNDALLNNENGELLPEELRGFSL
ncbi:MAG: division/cell wall cluster transcriptional repressor MraZ [Burkholderiales bacterium]